MLCVVGVAVIETKTAVEVLTACMIILIFVKFNLHCSLKAQVHSMLLQI